MQTKLQPRQLSIIDGWLVGSGSWSYVSADAPTFVASIADEDAAYIGIGSRIKLVQASVTKQFIVTAKAAPSGGFTAVTLYGGVNHVLTNSAISGQCYSHSKFPVGFDSSPAAWTVTVTNSADNTRNSPSQNNIYYTEMGSINISIPIGAWNVEWTAAMWASSSAAQTSVGIRAALSTANNSVSDTDLQAIAQNNMPSGSLGTGQTAQVHKLIVLAAKTTYYLVAYTPYTGGSTITFFGSSIKPTKIRAVSAYL